MVKKHKMVPFGHYYDFEKKKTFLLTDDATHEQTLHQYIGVDIEEED